MPSYLLFIAELEKKDISNKRAFNLQYHASIAAFYWVVGESVLTIKGGFNLI
jgi:hypothetical protein